MIAAEQAGKCRYSRGSTPPHTHCRAQLLMGMRSAATAPAMYSATIPRPPHGPRGRPGSNQEAEISRTMATGPWRVDLAPHASTQDRALPSPAWRVHCALPCSSVPWLASCCPRGVVSALPSHTETRRGKGGRGPGRLLSDGPARPPHRGTVRISAASIGKEWLVDPRHKKLKKRQRDRRVRQGLS